MVERIRLAVVEHVPTAAIKCQPNEQLLHIPSFKINWAYHWMHRIPITKREK